MKISRSFLTTLTTAILTTFLQPVVADDAATQTSIRVMSFNIRYGRANDGENHWDHRRQLVIRTIQKFDPDLLGTQETLGFQAEYLKQHLPHLAYVGWSRDADKDGEQCGVMFRRKRFTQLGAGQFWLSETPDEKFSRNWDAALPRIATWVRLQESGTQRELLFINTHFDHVGVKARLESARLLRRFVEEQPEGLPIVVTGDFNCGEGSDPWVQLTESARLVDSWRVVHPERKDDEGTFNGFKGRTDGDRIDWILVSPEFRVTEASIVRDSQDGRFPSDHFPVTAVIQFK